LFLQTSCQNDTNNNLTTDKKCDRLNAARQASPTRSAVQNQSCPKKQNKQRQTGQNKERNNSQQLSIYQQDNLIIQNLFASCKEKKKLGIRIFLIGLKNSVFISKLCFLG
jgi:hypothetical protein